MVVSPLNTCAAVNEPNPSGLNSLNVAFAPLVPTAETGGPNIPVPPKLPNVALPSSIIPFAKFAVVSIELPERSLAVTTVIW